jgi:hypothetical protein
MAVAMAHKRNFMPTDFFFIINLQKYFHVNENTQTPLYNKKDFEIKMLIMIFRAFADGNLPFQGCLTMRLL